MKSDPKLVVKKIKNMGNVMKKILLATLVLAFNANAMTEEECKQQAKTAKAIYGMIQDGIIIPELENESVAAYIKEASDLFDKGEYCEARKLIMALPPQLAGKQTNR